VYIELEKAINLSKKCLLCYTRVFVIIMESTTNFLSLLMLNYTIWRLAWAGSRFQFSVSTSMATGCSAMAMGAPGAITIGSPGM